MKKLIIIGLGPAGMIASIYAKRQGIDFEVITKQIGGEIINISEIGNYLGFEETSGLELLKRFKAHIEFYKIKYKIGEVVKIKKIDNFFKVILKNNESYKSEKLLLATGSIPRKLNVKGEKQFKGKGVSYCSICDGYFFKGKTVAVIGGGNSALESVLTLKDIVKKIYLITNVENLTAENYLIEKIKPIKNLEIIYNSTIKEILGSKTLEKILIENLKDSKLKTLFVQGIFINIGILPNSNYIDIVKKNENQEIIVDNFCRTSQKGIWAVGDVTNIPFKQIHIACGDAVKAILDISRQIK